MILKNEWQVSATTGNPPWDSDNTYVVGLESECRMISKMMVSTGIWSEARLYPPGSNSDIDEIDGSYRWNKNGDWISGPYETYAVADSGGEITEYEFGIKWKLTKWTESDLSHPMND